MKLDLKCFARAVAPLMLACGVAVVGCGGETDEKDSSSAGTPGGGTVAKAEGGKIEVSFSDAKAGAQYVLMPFAIGKAATNGASSETLTFSLATSSGSGGGFLDLTPQRGSLQFAFDQTQSSFDREHALRMLMNRFDSSKGLDQGNAFWSLAAQVDAADRAESNLRGFFARGDTGATTAFYQRAALLAPRTQYALTTAAACPTDSVPIPGATEPYELDEPATDKTDYCISYVHPAVTETDTAAIESTIAAIIKRYKDVIYKDQLTGATDYTFKPIVVVVDFKNSGVWPTSQANITGAYNGDVSAKQKMPVLYMAADLKKIDAYKDRSDAELKSLWYSTLAHEMQHAIIDFFRVQKTKGEREIAVLDEGLGHFMEDVFGHGDVNFKEYPGAYLSTFAFGTNPALGAEADANKAEVRGGSQALLYYLASQKGGIKFENGELKGGDGLDFIASVVKETSANGTKNLAAKFGGDWTETVGNFFGAVMLDNAKIDGVAEKYTAQDPVANVKNLAGATNATYGMSFNNFSSVTEKFSDVGDDQTLKSNIDVDGISFYQTKPILYTLTAEDAKVTVTTEAEGAAVAVIRIK